MIGSKFRKALALTLCTTGVLHCAALVPNETPIATAGFKDGAQVQLTRRANPATGESYYKLYLRAKDSKNQYTTKLQKLDFHLSALKSSTPLRFEMSDANHDGKEELFILLKDDNSTEQGALLSWNGKTLSVLHQPAGTQLTYAAGQLTYNAYDFDYGMTRQMRYVLNAKGSLSLDKTQCYNTGVRLGLSYEDFKTLLGSSSKKQYLNTNEKNASTRRFLIKSSYGQFIFEGPKQEGSNTAYTLVDMTFTDKGLQTLGGLSVGDRVDSLSAWLSKCQQENRPLLSSNFLAKEVLVKTNQETVAGQTEVWHFKHQNGVITEIRCELE